MSKIMPVVIILGLVFLLITGCSEKASLILPLPTPSSSENSPSNPQNVPGSVQPQTGSIQNDSISNSEDNSNKSLDFIQSGIKLNITQPLDGSTINGDAVNVTGQTVTGAIVTVNDQSGIADPNGNFNIQLNLESGLNPIDVVATDNNGNQSEILLLVMSDLSQSTPSQALGNNIPTSLTSLQNDLPLTISTPADGANISSGEVIVKGQTAPGAAVCINETIAIADASGIFNIAIDPGPGPAAIDILAVDDNGNQKEVILTVTVGTGS
jgi:hypothetical protein